MQLIYQNDKTYNTVTQKPTDLMLQQDNNM